MQTTLPVPPLLEKALAKFSDLVRVDKTGYDFIWEDETGNFIKIEMKMGQNLFYKRKDIHATKKFKVKSFLSEKKTVEDFKKTLLTIIFWFLI
jgi:hypothetical protein